MTDVAGPNVVVLDYGFGNVRSAVRALEKNGANVTLTADADAARTADGLVVPGVGAFAACMAGIRQVGGDQVIDARLAAGRPVLGICVGLQVMFAEGIEHGIRTAGLGYWGGTVDRLAAPIVPHMGWSKISAPAESVLFAGVADEPFYFVHSYGATGMPGDDRRITPEPRITWSDAGDESISVPFIAAVEDGPLSAVQFHPEKSSTAGLALIRNWLNTL